jgi:hypothetical protein
MAMVDTASIRASSTLPVTAVSARGCVRHIEPMTKGKVERFIRYLRQSFYVPLASRLAQEGLIVDRETANLAARRWLREVANARVHGTTGEVPAERLVIERLQLQPVPTPYGGRSVRSAGRRPAAPAVVL